MRGAKETRRETTLTKEQFRRQFEKVSEERLENDSEVLEEAVDEAEDLRGSEQARRWAEQASRMPDREEIFKEMRQMRDSAPGEDGVRLEGWREGD